MGHKQINLDLFLLVLYIIGYFSYRDASKCIIFMNKEVCVYDIFLTGIVGVFLVGYVLGTMGFKKDPMRKEIGICHGCDTWSILHTALYFILGYMFPNRYLFFFLAGVLWEAYESYSGKYDIMLFGYKINKDTDKNSDEAGSEWWYGRALDICVNMFGYIMGTYYANGKLTLSHMKEEFLF